MNPRKRFYKKRSLAIALLTTLYWPTVQAATIGTPKVETVTTSSVSIDANATDFYIFGENAKGGPQIFTDVSASPSGALSTVSSSTVKVTWSGGDSTGSTKFDVVGFGSRFKPNGTSAQFTLKMPSTAGTLKFWLIPNGNTKKISYNLTVGGVSKSYSDTTGKMLYNSFTYEISSATKDEEITVKVDGVTGENVWHNIGFQAAQFIAKVVKQDQTVSFTTPPATGTVGQTAAVKATASSGLTNITLSSNPQEVCTVSSDQITFKAPGTCKITATQAGNENYQAATAHVEILVANPPKTTQLGSKTVNDAEFSLNAQSTADLPVQLTLDPQSQGICELRGDIVKPVGMGTCIIHAFKLGMRRLIPRKRCISLKSPVNRRNKI